VVPSLPGTVDFPVGLPPVSMLRRKHSRASATTCLPEEAAAAATMPAATPLIAVLRLETKWKISESRPRVPFPCPLSNVQSGKMQIDLSTTDVLLVDRIPPFLNSRSRSLRQNQFPKKFKRIIVGKKAKNHDG